MQAKGPAAPPAKTSATASTGAASWKPTPTGTAWRATPAPRAQTASTAAAATATPAQAVATPPGPWATLDARLDKDTGSRALDGNKVTMLFDGVNSFAERNQMIDGAKESICLQTFIFNSDDTGWDLANRLAAKAKQGVQVRVIYDGMGSNRADPKMFEMMKQAGVELREYGDPVKQFWNFNDRWHEKHLIVDGKASVEGGMNIANEYALGGSGKMVFSRVKDGEQAWRDCDLKLEGPAVHDTTSAFLNNWKELGADVSDADRAKLLPRLEAQPSDTKVRVVQHHPNDETHDSNTLKLYQHAIESAQKSITIENAYFLPPPEVRKALIDAAHRGVDVKIMTNSRESNDMGFVADASRYFYDDLIKAGAKIYEKQGGTLHAKTATFDGQYSIVGSVNLNGRSDGRDAEVALGVSDPSTASQLEQRFATGLSQAKPITMGELDKEGFFKNLEQWALSTLAWTF